MDALVFKTSQKLDDLSIQFQLINSKLKEVLIYCSKEGKLLLFQCWNSSTVEHLKSNINNLLIKVLNLAKDIQGRTIILFDPKRIAKSLSKVFGTKWTRRDVYFGCAGFLIGGILGLTVGLLMRKNKFNIRYMQAVQCNSYLGTESITVVEDAFAPNECGEYDVLVDVKAASVQFIDMQICNGYGSSLRKILQRIYKQSNSDLPVILGRDCTGIITDIGSRVNRLEIGDEVWLTVPFWSQGTLCQTILALENRVSQKPKNIGFEGACSLPYAGSLALSALERLKVDSDNAPNKRILIHGGCTPVGCVLIQLLKHWRASVTATCYKRAVPVVKALGVSDIIVLSESTVPNNALFVEGENEMLRNTLIKELELKGYLYDGIILTCNEYIKVEDLRTFCQLEGRVISALPPTLASDSYGFFGRIILSFYINLKYTLKKMFGLQLDEYDEMHLCYITLDKLAKFVEDGYLQTVVDKVYQPPEIERAVNHLQSSHSIGSTVITFR